MKKIILVLIFTFFILPILGCNKIKTAHEGYENYIAQFDKMEEGSGEWWNKKITECDYIYIKQDNVYYYRALASVTISEYDDVYHYFKYFPKTKEIVLLGKNQEEYAKAKTNLLMGSAGEKGIIK